MAAGIGEAAHAPGMHELVVLANICIVIAIVYFGARKGILASLQNRSHSIREKLLESKTELAKVENALSAARSELRDFENTKNRMIAEVRSEAEHLSRGIMDEAKHAAERILQDAKLAAKSEASGAMMDLKNNLVAEAVNEAKKILSQSKDQQASVHKQLFELMNNDIKGVQTNGR